MLEAEFFYRNPLENNEAKPAFGLEEPDPNNERPNHTGFIKKISNGREENHTLDTSGFSLILCPTKVKDFYNDEEVSSIYYPEMHEVVKKETGANQVQIISHITRNEEEAAQGKRLGAHRLVHNDFTPQFQSIVDEFLNSDPGMVMKTGLLNNEKLTLYRTIALYDNPQCLEKQFDVPGYNNECDWYHRAFVTMLGVNKDDTGEKFTIFRGLNHGFVVKALYDVTTIWDIITKD